MTGVYPESEWTLPSEWCPRPELWHSTDPQSTEIEISELAGAMVRALQPEYVIETGSCLGQTAFAIALALSINGHGRLDTLEVEAERAEFTRQRIARHLPNALVTVHEVPSLDFTPADVIGFAWLDSRLELRVPEFERYRPWMKSGAIVGFHDTAPHHGAWGDEIDKLPGTRHIQLRSPRGVTLVEVL